jgi:hypothetical protein
MSVEEGLQNTSQETLEDLLDLYHLWQMSKYMEKTSCPARVLAEDGNLRWRREVPIYRVRDRLRYSWAESMQLAWLI